MIYSLDIFDTLLLRDESPVDTLRRLPDHYRDERLRLHVEKYPRSIDEFYQSINENIELELRLECEHLRVNDELMAFVAREEKETFLLVSDMYLSSEYIERILKTLGVPRFYEKLYISSECGASKEDFGKLFEVVAAEYGRDIVHIGDKLKSDFFYPNMRLHKGVHYIKESAKYCPDFSSLEAYYKHYCDHIIAPLMYLSVEKIKAIVKNKNIKHVVCIGSVFNFYRDLLIDRLSDIVVKRLDISRYNILFLMYADIPVDDFVRMTHTGSFLAYFYPLDFHSVNVESLSIFDQWKHYADVIEKNKADLNRKSEEAKTSFNKQLCDKNLLSGDVLFVDFGYQGSFCDFVANYSAFKNKTYQVFLTVKEYNPKHSCFVGVEVQPFKMPTKGVRDPFWILDAEIIIKKDSVTPIAFSVDHKSSSGWLEMYEYLLSAVKSYQPPASLYELERELEYKIFKHVCQIDHNYLLMFNQLSQKVGYNKYSMKADHNGLISKVNGCVQVNVGRVVELEEVTYGKSELFNVRDNIEAITYDKKSPFFQYYRYLESILECDKLFFAS
jgi:hypothetical protein